jgi:hypothetical protein
LSSVPAGASGEVNVTLKAPTMTVAHAPLVVAAALRNSGGQILAQASDAKVMYVTRELSYALTTMANTVQPGQGIQITVTVNNLSTATQTVPLNYDVPQFTTSGGSPAGTAFSYFMGNIAAHTTESVTFSFTVLSRTEAPPNGSLITLVVTDRANGALVSYSVAVNLTLAVLERLSSPRSKRILTDSLTVARRSSLRFAPTTVKLICEARV